MSFLLLNAQETRRQQGHAAISALRGPVEVGVSCWRTWCEANQRACMVSRSIDPRRWIEDYIQSFLRECHLLPISKQTLAERLSVSGESLSPARLTWAQLARLLDQAGLTDAGADRFYRRFLEAEVKGEPISTEAVFRWFSTDPEGEPWLETIAAIIDFLPIGLSPALLVAPMNLPSDPSCDSGLLEKAAQPLAVLISQIPLATVGLCAPDACFEHYLKSAPESYSKAVLRESLISVSGLSAGEISQTLTQHLGSSVSRWERPIEQLAARGASQELVDSFSEAVLEFHQTEPLEKPPDGEISEPPQKEVSRTVEEPDAARSSAERFLHALLESTPDLAGLFELNVKPGFDFGGRPAEIDLACLSKRIAVEIDGYHHFTDSAAYRRDRRKDVLLQEHGYFVLRFLAEDVVSQMEFICDSIRTVVNLRA